MNLIIFLFWAPWIERYSNLPPFSRKWCNYCTRNMDDARLNSDKATCKIPNRNIPNRRPWTTIRTVPWPYCTVSPLVAMDDSPLCPVKSLRDMLSYFPKSSRQEKIPLFAYDDGKTVKCLTYASFVKSLKFYLDRCGYSSADYSGHSFRRGGCSFAFKIGLPPALIKLRGDWRSNAYERYITIDNDLQLKVAKAMSIAAKKA